MKRKKVLLIGSGGREHALAWKISQSPELEKLYIAPGNGGTKTLGENVPIRATDIFKLAAFAREKQIDLTVVGPDDPLALGIVDVFRNNNLRIFGPTKAAMQIESSKAFAMQLLRDILVPTADFAIFRRHQIAEAARFLDQSELPIVVKASGLALGKGSYVCRTHAEAVQALREIAIDRVHGDAGNEILIEKFVEGPEVSLHAFCDGIRYFPFPPTQDHKHAFENDQGPMTGGMGVVPASWLTSIGLVAMNKQTFDPILRAMNDRGMPFTGLLYPGVKGGRVLECNGRFGDPETQVCMRNMRSDILPILEACSVFNGLEHFGKITFNPEPAVCVVMASGGYPSSNYRKGLPITGIKEAEKVPGVIVFHAGTVDDDGLRTNGGRVLGVTATGRTLRKALDNAYEAVRRIHFEGMFYRTDIGKKALALL